jgi:ribonucleoside-diphosphate reductase subunit M2
MQADANRFVLFPIQYDGIWKLYKKFESQFWCATTIDAIGDYKQLSKLGVKEQEVTSQLIAWLIIR